MPQLTVTAPERDTCWSITPKGRAALNAPTNGQRYAQRVAARVGWEVTNL